MNAIVINEEEEQEQKITEYITTKKYIGDTHNIKFLGKAKFLEFIGGREIIKINSHIEELKFIGGNVKLIIRAPIDKLTIVGGDSLIYIYPIQNMEDPQKNKIGEMKIIGGQHNVYVNSDIDNLNIIGGNSKVYVDFQICKINNFKPVGGKIYLNPGNSTNEGPESIFSTKLNNDKIENPCAICLEDMISGNDVYFLPCFHCFHKNCLKQWMNNKETCPKCNLKITYQLA